MALVLREIVIDCNDPAALARFWGQALGWEVQGHASGALWMSASGESDAAPLLVFVPGAAADQPRNRVRLYAGCTGADRGREVDRLVALGARRLEPDREGQGWTALADPEGNRFGVLDAPEPSV